MPLAKGTIRREIELRGFGLIQSEDRRIVFFHRLEVHHVHFCELQEGQVVAFVVENIPLKARRRDVRAS